MATTRLGRLAPLTTRIFNPAMRPLAGRLPGLGLLTHVGRRTGRTFRTPVLVVRHEDQVVIGLWYGSQTNWPRNLLAAGRGRLKLSGRDLGVTSPEMVVDPTLELLPPVLRLPARLVGMRDVIRMRLDGATPVSPP